ncbi:MAG: hypothetical protein FJY37_11790 [Betaproteobacteria bacterium]|nr:hypothetical protein [Betaproteobacteria bacterium]
MPFAYFDRLSPGRQRIYLKSDAIESVPLPSGLQLEPVLAALSHHLADEQRPGVEAAAQQLIDALVDCLQVPPLAVKVLAVRPHGNWGELHGLYEPMEPPARSVISVWMRTVARKQVVAYKSLVRTLLHEFCHHLDYELYQLPETFHTEGFYKRESSLFHQLHPAAL